MREQGSRGGRGRGGTSSSRTDSQTPTSGRTGGRYGTPSSDRPRGGRHGGRGSRGGRGRSPYNTNNGTPSARLPGGGGSTGSRVAFDRGRIFGAGQEAVRYEKEKRLWKVGPPHGDHLHRFQLAAFLNGLTQFIDYQLEQRPAPGHTPGASVQHNKNKNIVSSNTAGGGDGVGGGGARQDEEDEQDDSEQLEDESSGTVSLGEFAALALSNDDEDSEEDEEKEEEFEKEEESSSASPSRTWWTSSSLVNDSLLDTSILPRNPVATKEEEEAAAVAASAAATAAIAPPAGQSQRRQRQPQVEEGPLQLSLRLERLDLTDVEASMLADWAAQHAEHGTAIIRKLWLFGNRFSDDGGAVVARILALGTVTECHLSHNLITLVGAQKLLENVPVGEPAEPAELVSEVNVKENDNQLMMHKSLDTLQLLNPLWLRLEWNRISLSGLVNVLEAQHAQRGLLCDVPEAAREDAAPPLPTLPNYLHSAKKKNNTNGNNNNEENTAQSISALSEDEEKDAGKAGSPFNNKNSNSNRQSSSSFTRSTRNQLNFIIDHCHCRLPWVSSQFETPSEAAVLLNAKNLWGSSKLNNLISEVSLTAAVGGGTAGESSSSVENNVNATMVANRNKIKPISSSTPSASLASSLSSSSGPLLLVPDTSALLAMAGADPSMTTPTFFTLEWLFFLSTQGLFGRRVPPREQIFIIVPASVATQLDALKSDPGCRSAVRRFMSKGLDDMGPAGANFLTMLGAHEGEGLILDSGAEVAGSRGADVASRGQATDHRIVEVGLYFQQECVKAAVDAEPQAGTAVENSISGVVLADKKEKQTHISSLPVILLTSDNGQQALAKAHGLPAVRMPDLAAVKARIVGHVEAGQPFTASLFRDALRSAATAALGKVAARSLQMEFDGAVACLRTAVEHLSLAQNRERALRDALGESASEANGEAQLIEALEKRLKEWDGLIRSHQVASRVLQWSHST